MKPGKILLNKWQKRLLYGAVALLWSTGAMWLLLAVSDSSRPLWMRIHGAAAMAFLILFGTVLTQHVPVGWKQNRQRPSGSFLLAVCVILMLTGYGLYYFSGDAIRHWTSLTHSTFGLALPVLISLHIFLGRRD